jgi:hypothetical protein
MAEHERVRRAVELYVDAALDELAAHRGTTQARLSAGDKETLFKLAYATWRACERQRPTSLRGVWESPSEAQTPVQEPDALLRKLR